MNVNFIILRIVGEKITYSFKEPQLIHRSAKGLNSRRARFENCFRGLGKMSKYPRENLGEILGQKETCRNPFILSCGSSDITLYILINRVSYPICWSCWKFVGSSSIEWSSQNKSSPKLKKKILRDFKHNLNMLSDYDVEYTIEVRPIKNAVRSLKALRFLISQ